MKRIILIASLLTVSYINAQAYRGARDTKLQIGTSFQDNATGINASYDIGMSENISLGLSSSYAININETIDDAKFQDRFDLKARFNANIGNVINIDDRLDIYPGLNISFKNFGGHLGIRYFFTDGFGIFTELNTPIAKFGYDKTLAQKLYNQFTVNFGTLFSI